MPGTKLHAGRKDQVFISANLNTEHGDGRAGFVER